MSTVLEARALMVHEQIVSRGIRDRQVLAAMGAVPRERFVPLALRDLAHADRALRIGHGATISQPYLVALMSELARIRPGDRVLEIGTGSGYQAAVLVELGAEVFSIERVEVLHDSARARFAELGLAIAQGRGQAGSIHMRHGDGFDGWPDAAPFDAILLTAAPRELPLQLINQLVIGGRLVAPVGPRWMQSLQVVERSEAGALERHATDVTFVPMLPGLA